MRPNYSLSSQEINDRTEIMYEYLVNLLGFSREGYTRYSGVYQSIEASGLKLLQSSSGIPNVADNELYSSNFFYEVGKMSYQTNMRNKINRKWGT